VSRIGIDVGGTNTDAVLIDGSVLLRTAKTPTTPDVLSGIRRALAMLLDGLDPRPDPAAVVVGTTHFTNAVVERRGLDRVAALRIGLPASASLPPFVDWPADLAGLVRGTVHMVAGGHEYDGQPTVPLDRAALRQAAERIGAAGLTRIAVSSVFSPLVTEDELEAERILREVVPHASITLSHRLGRIGLLERENVTLLNAALQGLASRTVAAFEAALEQSGIAAPLFLSQNDGTMTGAALAAAFPVYCFASGPTNSMRGAAFLSGVMEGVVVDVGGTTSDIGALRAGFPREANSAVEIGGVRTLFRMPDLLSIGLGGGTMIGADDAIGPRSTGYRIAEEARIFGGGTLTATDIAVAAGRVALGDPARVADLAPGRAEAVLGRMDAMIAEAIDRMKTDEADVPLIAVGGGAFLVPDRVPGTSRVLRVENGAVANAVGAAIAQVSAELDQIFSGLDRDAAIAAATEAAQARAVQSGADTATLAIVELEDLPIAYLPGDARRVRVKVVGDIRQQGDPA
jgi:N-methylhydantoinase A/oxoprolinase/acetone carboxylase beta subunit